MGGPRPRGTVDDERQIDLISRCRGAWAGYTSALLLYCAPTGAGGENPIRHAIGAAGFGHCFVRVKCECQKYDKRLEVTGSQEGRAVIPRVPPSFAEGHYAQRVAILPADNNSRECSTEECVLKRYEELRARGYRYPAPGAYITGPNSNTFAKELLLSCGIPTIMWPSGIPPFAD